MTAPQVSASTTLPATDDDVIAAADRLLLTVDDPEYPGLSIVDLGLVEEVDAIGSSVVVSLIPTFAGCPALHMIAADVTTALEADPRIDSCEVRWLATPLWSSERITNRAKDRLASSYTVVLRSKDGSLRCPICGNTDVRDQSMVGPTRCRSIAWCDDCRNPVEVMR